MMIPPPRPDDDPRNAPVYLRKTLLAQGLDDRTIRRLVAEGTLIKVRRGAYADRPDHDLLDAAGRHGLRARAVCQQARTSVVLSHVSGLPEYDAPTWGLDLSEIHVTRPDGRAGRREAGVQQHCGTLLEGDVVERHGVLVMTPPRLVLEVTTVATAEAGLVVANHFLHCGMTTKEELLERYALVERWPYSLRTRLVLHRADARIETVGESRTLHLIATAGLPAPECQYPIRAASGRVLYRVDFAWPELGVFLEFDGRVKYEKLLGPGERASDVVLAE
ncbi:hypothetical protein GON03_12340 [Nocardioides sp. MAH-18]|uniref:AbiEi antitoxin N-terminal domain-containing protein n=1 Tax=Nocardioides agri TaxID=2682843 RepID=A0A6L6XRL1_9ACTN|nr:MULTISPECIES: type IV toxin-antitoxin system AbiEi family antitoxin domain-containing protein [unclassified Nocardioides]MBA2955121.1 type IV toxin-antitoxin system AbiEi family antitoxin domain-containing protein [Nocardioides sp. CGMCC 1.13656]MVQ49974.1 hypothetical protein [Nocardioides sp. MAH-18]